MKIKLSVSAARQEEIRLELGRLGIEVCDDGEFTLIDSGRYIDRLLVKNSSTDERVFVAAEDIVFIEAFGHDVEVHTAEKSYATSEPLYKLEGMLDPADFLRISNSVIIRKDKIRSVSPTFQMKFILTMNNGRRVDVTRSYYRVFRDAFGI